MSGGVAARVPRIGVLFPGHSAEDEYPRVAAMMRPPVLMEVIHTRVPEDAHREDALLRTGDVDLLLEAGEALRRFGADVAVWACTSGSFVFGWEGAHEQVQQLAESFGIPVSSTSVSFARVLQETGYRRVAVAATYPEDVARLFVQFVNTAGVEVVSMSGLGIITGVEVGTLGGEAVIELVRRNDHPDAEAVLVPDTALHTIAWLDDLEAAVGKPVLTANQVTTWDALRLVGHPLAQSGLGSLFAGRYAVHSP